MSKPTSARVRALRRAELLLGRQALRERLKVPMRDLELWLRGEDAPPTDVFLKVVDLLLDQVVPKQAAEPQQVRAASTIQIHIGPNAARCPACDCTEFRPRDPSAPVGPVAVLICTYCGRESTHGDLVVVAVDDAAKLSGAMVNKARRVQSARQDTSGAVPAEQDARAKKEE